jgi:hypothetical protein
MAWTSLVHLSQVKNGFLSTVGEETTKNTKRCEKVIKLSHEWNMGLSRIRRFFAALAARETAMQADALFSRPGFAARNCSPHEPECLHPRMIEFGPFIRCKRLIGTGLSR